MKILLAVDSSEASDTAVREVAARPWPDSSTVHVFSVAPPAKILDIANLAEELQRTADEIVHRALEQLRGAPLRIIGSTSSGDPKDVILDHAQEIGAELIVIGAHGTTGLAGMLASGVSKAILRFAPCSVELVRAQRSPDPLRILLATDGSEFSEAAARSVAARPWPAGSEIRILSVVEVTVPVLRSSFFDSKAMEELRAGAMKRAEEAVMAAEQILLDAGLQASGTEAVPSATPKELILSEAGEWGADLIVLGSHHRRGLSRFLLGSVSEAVALHAPCSVEIIRITPIPVEDVQFAPNVGARFEPTVQ